MIIYNKQLLVHCLVVTYIVYSISLSLTVDKTLGKKSKKHNIILTIGVMAGSLYKGHIASCVFFFY